MTLPHLSLVIGGAASGKSAFAEALVRDTGRPRVYVATATATATDDEMRAKIARHRALRGLDWTTVEEPFDMGAALATVAADQVVLVDCATLWLTNHLLAEHDLEAECAALQEALAASAAPVVVVTNEVGQGIVPDNALSRRFRNAQGALNRQLASRAGLVVTVIAGLPLVLKGALPQ